MRERLGLIQGSQFVVVGEDDVVILKAIKPPSMEDFDRLVGQAEEAAEGSGMTPEHVEAAVREVRERT